MRITLNNGTALRISISHKDADTDTYALGLVKKPNQARPVNKISSCYVSKEGTKEVLAEGSSYCIQGDTFSRHKGASTAVARAIAPLKLAKNERKLIWDTLFSGVYNLRKPSVSLWCVEINHKDTHEVETVYYTRKANADGAYGYEKNYYKDNTNVEVSVFQVQSED